MRSRLSLWTYLELSIQSRFALQTDKWQIKHAMAGLCSWNHREQVSAGSRWYHWVDLERICIGPLISSSATSGTIFNQFPYEYLQGTESRFWVYPSPQQYQSGKKLWDSVHVMKMKQMFRETYMDQFSLEDPPSQLINFATGAVATADLKLIFTKLHEMVELVISKKPIDFEVKKVKRSTSAKRSKLAEFLKLSIFRWFTWNLCRVLA